MEAVRTIPGVHAVGVTSRPPLRPGNPQDNIDAEGRELRRGEVMPVANYRYVSTEYFEAIGTPLRRGRAFVPADLLSSERVVESGILLTSQGPGTCFEFALRLLRKLRGPDVERDVAGPLILPG